MEEEKVNFVRKEIPKPVAIGEVVQVTIESEGAQGDGIAKKDGFILFIKGAKKGETCKVKVTELKRTYGIAQKA
ncbi:MAG: TRAM domain-containing protein [Candidatus Micrarchaeia archaeon]|jgi:predicted RNA-binding protein with TRAM domain